MLDFPLEQPLTVTQINSLINEVLSQTFFNVVVEGEISNVSRPASGHIYFRVKDEKSQIAAVMWRGVAQAVSFPIAVGQKVIIHAKASVYSARGDLQLNVSKILMAGDGDLQRKFLELKARLEQEGLFAPERKRKIPFLPRAIGIVTSSSGAVIKDIMVKLQERMANVQAYLVPVRVQGEGAAQEIASAIGFLNTQIDIDVIIVARGGGSLEDLWAFNEEVVVRAIFGSRIPVVSGVGHEVDITLSDLVADQRAPTPTAAAEIVVPKRFELQSRINELGKRISDYHRWLDPLEQRVDELEARIGAQVLNFIERYGLRLTNLESRLKLIEPSRVIALYGAKIDIQFGKLAAHMQRSTLEKKSKIELLSSRLDSANPLTVLSRGYAIVESDGAVVRDSAAVKLGQTIKMTFSSGYAKAKVTEKSS